MSLSEGLLRPKMKISAHLNRSRATVILGKKIRLFSVAEFSLRKKSQTVCIASGAPGASFVEPTSFSSHSQRHLELKSYREK